jgi:cholesterol transport system auxiliary component
MGRAAIPALLGAALLAGCGGLLLGPQPAPVKTYLFAPELPGGGGAAMGGPAIALSPPEAAAGYGTRRMAYVESDYRLDYFAENEWVDTPSRMLHPLLTKALRATGRFRGVAEEGQGIATDLRLDTLILEVRQDFRRQPSRGSVRLRAHLLDTKGRRLLATRSFEAQAPAPSDDPYGGVVAINQVLAELIREVAEFAAEAASGR